MAIDISPILAFLAIRFLKSFLVTTLLDISYRFTLKNIAAREELLCWDKLKQVMELKRQAIKSNASLKIRVLRSTMLRSIKIVINGAQIFNRSSWRGAFGCSQQKEFRRRLLRAINSAN